MTFLQARQLLHSAEELGIIVLICGDEIVAVGDDEIVLQLCFEHVAIAEVIHNRISWR